MKTMKKLIALVVSLVMLLAFAGCGSKNETTKKDSGKKSSSDFKIGVILVGDENEGYTYAHI